jgi:hypothetical protein
MDAVRVFQTNGVEGVVDFRCQQVSMLKSDLLRRALQMDINPARALKTIGPM